MLKLCQSFVYRENVKRLLVAKTYNIVQSDLCFVLAAAFKAVSRAGVFDQYFTHQTRRDPEKMSSILPFYRILADEPDIGFVYEGRRLERVFRSFFRKMAARQAAKLRVNHRQQLIKPFAGFAAEVGKYFCNGSVLHIIECLRLKPIPTRIKNWK